MLRHVAMGRWIEGVVEEQRQAAIAGLRELTRTVEHLGTVAVHRDSGLAREGEVDHAPVDNHDVIVVGDFPDWRRFREYMEHPEHRKLSAERLALVLTDTAAIQYEVPG